MSDPKPIRPRGRPVGSGHPNGPRPGSVRGWLTTARVGAVLWTEQDTQQVVSTAGRVGKQVRSARYYALHPETQTVIKLARIEVIGLAKGGANAERL